MNISATDDSPAMLTRHDVATRLGVSIATVRRMEGSALHPTVDSQGVHWFAVTEVRSVSIERSQKPLARGADEGEVAARVFELFRLGADLRKVVIAVRVHPRVVRALYAEWLVSLNDGERARRETQEDAEARRVRARVEREYRAMERDFASR